MEKQELQAYVSLKELVPVGELGYIVGQIQKLAETKQPLSEIKEPIKDIVFIEHQVGLAKTKFETAVKQIKAYFNSADQYIDEGKRRAKAYVLEKFKEYKEEIDKRDTEQYGKPLGNYDGFVLPNLFSLRNSAPKVSFNKIDIELNPELAERYKKVVVTIDETKVKNDILAGILTKEQVPSLKIETEPTVALLAQKVLDANA